MAAFKLLGICEPPLAPFCFLANQAAVGETRFQRIFPYAVGGAVGFTVASDKCFL
jgi:hypothetical protein